MLPLPPRWALGYGQSRWSYFPEAQVREEIARRPELKQATYCVPHYGKSGTAANMVMHVAALKRAEASAGNTAR